MARSSKMVFVALKPSLRSGTGRHSCWCSSRKSNHLSSKDSKTLLIYLVPSLYLAQFVESLFSAVQSNLNPYITSSFDAHGLTAVVSIVASITGGVCNLFIAKILDIWGRVEGFFCMLLLIVVGSIMKAACHNIETYAAANTIYWVSWHTIPAETLLLHILTIVGWSHRLFVCHHHHLDRFDNAP
jgi:hypothetical protein